MYDKNPIYLNIIQNLVTSHSDGDVPYSIKSILIAVFANIKKLSSIVYLKYIFFL